MSNGYNTTSNSSELWLLPSRSEIRTENEDEAKDVNVDVNVAVDVHVDVEDEWISPHFVRNREIYAARGQRAPAKTTEK
ncbi:hypothetical protein ACLKA7_015729 [Drosophila subpalustris]